MPEKVQCKSLIQNFIQIRPVSPKMTVCVKTDEHDLILRSLRFPPKANNDTGTENV